MVLRVEGQDLIECNIGVNNTEDGFISRNPGYFKVENVPYSLSGYYMYDTDGTTIIVNTEKELVELQSIKMNDVLYKFEDMMFYGQFECSLGFTTDNRRGDGKDDKDNVQSLIDLGQEPIYFRDADSNFHVLSIADLVLLKQEMIQDGLGKYQWKWSKETEIMSTTVIADLNSIEI